jgi:hypothetical protein
MREALIELNASDIGAEMGVIVSREENTPDYDSVKDLPAFYTRVSKDENRTVYLSMTDKMTNRLIERIENKTVEKAFSHFDKSDPTYNPLEDVPELMHPNTKYYAHIYSAQGGLNSGATTTKIEFTTEATPTTFPPTPTTYPNTTSRWSDLRSKWNSGPVIEYKRGELYFYGARARFDLSGGKITKLTLTYASTPNLEIETKFTNGSGKRPVQNPGIGNLVVYDFYTTTNYELYDTMFLHYTGSKPYSSLGALPILINNFINTKAVFAGALNRGEDNNMVEVTE